MNQFANLIEELTEAYSENAEEMAAAQRKHFEALVDEGFTEPRAFELIKEMEMNADAK